MPSQAETGPMPDVFRADAYAREVLQLRAAILSLRDVETRDKITQHVLTMQAMLSPVITEYLDAHPESDQRQEMATDLYHGPLSWLTED